MSCPCLEGCEFPGLLSTTTAVRHWQGEYCHPRDAYRECERWKAVSAGRSIPRGMFPNGFVPPQE